ncbi:restriction endonuclease subunit S [Mycoplasmopsis felis]|uniref:restriction endonuclease subunit S n=1 Tax=Mycoplasmopsis felis TaxID=33923 RepID=UPI002AFF1EE2|nr:restriction endonuclease subunit S [Mycoplasmopsis felis]WQQ09769.1 restriction endonuclease subunit S [Mycoplasmopsis felis]
MKKVLVPKVRFKGFSEEWKEEKLEYIAKVTNGKSNTSDNNKWGQYNLYIRSEEIYKSNKYIFDVEGVITVGDGNIGKIFHYVNGKFDLHQRCYLIYEFQNIWPKYFYYYFSQNFYKRAILMSYTATVNSIRMNTITDMDIMFPKELIEQQKIGKLLENIDNLINLENSKLNKLKQLKETLLQKIFPEGNSKTPRIRFKGFEGEWKEEKLEYIAKVTNGKSNTSDNNKWGQYNLYIRSEEIYKSNKYIFDVEGVITVGDGNIGKIFHYVNGKFDLHQRCYLIYEFQNIWPKYFYYYFSQNFYKRAILMSYTATVNSIRMNTITDMDIMFPKELIEQQKIGDFFSNIDTLINLYNSKLNKLKQIKEALLQKLLI